MKTGIFSLISRQRLQEVLGTLHAYTELTLELLDAEGNLLMAFGDPPRHCMLMRTHVFRHNECAELKRKAVFEANRRASSESRDADGEEGPER